MTAQTRQSCIVALKVAIDATGNPRARWLYQLALAELTASEPPPAPPKEPHKRSREVKQRKAANWAVEKWKGST